MLGYRASLWLHGCTTAEVASSELLRNKEACHDAQPPRCLAALHAHTVALHALNAAGRAASFVELSSPYGHDAFLLESPPLDRVVAGFLGGGQG